MAQLVGKALDRVDGECHRLRRHIVVQEDDGGGAAGGAELLENGVGTSHRRHAVVDSVGILDEVVALYQQLEDRRSGGRVLAGHHSAKRGNVVGSDDAGRHVVLNTTHHSLLCIEGALKVEDKLSILIHPGQGIDKLQVVQGTDSKWVGGDDVEKVVNSSVNERKLDERHVFGVIGVPKGKIVIGHFGGTGLCSSANQVTVMYTRVE